MPSLVPPGTLVWLWVLLAVLLAGGVSTLFLRVPEYAAGTGWVVDRQAVVAVFTPDQARKLRPGQILQLSAGGAEWTGTISSVEGNVVRARVATPPRIRAGVFRVRVRTGTRRIVHVAT